MLFYLVAVFYLCWLALTCASQPLFTSNQWLLRFDIFRLIPVWTFFAPNPGVSDYNLLFRYRLADGTITVFREIPFRSPKTIGAIFFNPGRRLQKALSDHVRTLLIQIDRDLNEENRENIKLTAGYISVLHYCAQLPPPPDADQIQFILLESFGYLETREPQLILNSEFHKL